MTALTNKSELLFLYDVADANPNGDPLDENKPRIDEETGQNIVTDVRLKRTIRDYLFEYKGFNGENEKDIFVRDVGKADGKKQDGITRAGDFDGDKKIILKRCIDIRLFGGTIPLKKDSITLTGPVQFKMGRSLHPVVMKHIQGTGAFASKEGAKQFTFREEDVLYYSLIAFHGIINPAAAKYSRAGEEDVRLLLEGMWDGTKNLISRSKFGQMPRFLLKLNYNSPLFFIGDLNHLVSIESGLPNEKLRSVGDLRLDVGELKESIGRHKEKIASIEYMVDSRLALIADGKKATLDDIVGGVDASELTFE